MYRIYRLKAITQVWKYFKTKIFTITEFFISLFSKRTVASGLTLNFCSKNRQNINIHIKTQDSEPTTKKDESNRD